MDISRSTLIALGIGLGAVVLLVVGVAAAFVLPTLQRLDRTLLLMEETLPMIEEIQPDVASVEGELTTVTPEISGMRGDVADLDDRILELRDPIEQLDDRLADLQGQLGHLDHLPLLRDDLAAVAGSIDGLRGDLHAMRDATEMMAQVLVGLDRHFEEIVALLEETAEHVENLDHKTGPPPPGDPPW